jgi:hypothetical protein
MVAAVTTNVGRDLAIAHKSVWIIAGVFNAGMILVLLVLHWASGRAQRRLERANTALAVQNQAVRESRERMVQAADSTKRAIAEELHGTVQGTERRGDPRSTRRARQNHPGSRRCSRKRYPRHLTSPPPEHRSCRSRSWTTIAPHFL